MIYLFIIYFTQEAIFEKDAGKVYLKSFSLYKKLLTFSRAGHEQGKATCACCTERSKIFTSS